MSVKRFTPERELSRNQYAARIGISTAEASRRLKAGEVPGAYRIGARWHIPLWGVRAEQERRAVRMGTYHTTSKQNAGAGTPASSGR